MVRNQKEMSNKAKSTPIGLRTRFNVLHSASETAPSRFIILSICWSWRTRWASCPKLSMPSILYSTRHNLKKKSYPHSVKDHVSSHHMFISITVRWWCKDIFASWTNFNIYIQKGNLAEDRHPLTLLLIHVYVYSIEHFFMFFSDLRNPEM